MLHASPAVNAGGIKSSGILAAKSQGARATVWLVAQGMTGQALTHAAKRHGISPLKVMVYVVDVPRSWLRKGKRKGLWHTGGRDIPFHRVRELRHLVCLRRPALKPKAHAHTRKASGQKSHRAKA